MGEYGEMGSEYGVWRLTERGWEAAKSKQIFATVSQWEKLISSATPEAKAEIETILKKAGVLK